MVGFPAGGLGLGAEPTPADSREEAGVLAMGLQQWFCPQPVSLCLRAVFVCRVKVSVQVSVCVRASVCLCVCVCVHLCV